MAYVVYSPSGRVLQVYNGQFEQAPIAPQGCTIAAVEGDVGLSPFEHFDGAALAQSTVIDASLDKADITADGIEAATLSGLPDPCWLMIDGIELQVIGGSYQVKSAAPATIRLELVGQYHGGPWFVAAHDLTALKTQVKDRIDSAAETCRLKYITPGSGQAMVYQQKAEEAKACLAATGPVAADYPLLAAEADATFVTISALAATVAMLTAQGLGLAAAIEALRIGGKKTATDALTVAAVLAAEVINWP
jgi:hypothetical protein